MPEFDGYKPNQQITLVEGVGSCEKFIKNRENIVATG